MFNDPILLPIQIMIFETRALLEVAKQLQLPFVR